jgi:hypothetical protein
MFKYQVLSDAELHPNQSKLKEGFATFKIIDANDKDKYNNVLTSKAGNQMMEVKFLLRDNLGNEGILKDYFLADQSWKIHKLLSAINKAHWYKSGALQASDLKNQVGQCMLKADPSPQYPEKVKIGSYVEQEQAETVNNQAPRDPLDTLDDIPF